MDNYALIENDIVVNVVAWNGIEYNEATGSGWSPPSGVIAIKVEPGDTPNIGLGYSAGVYEQPPLPMETIPTPAEILATNHSRQKQLTAEASQAMTPVLVSLQLGDATDDEIATAKAWQVYYRALQLVDVTVVSPSWPAAPD
jgi:hypothetical protein